LEASNDVICRLLIALGFCFEAFEMKFKLIVETVAFAISPLPEAFPPE